MNIVLVCFETAPGDLFHRHGPHLGRHPALSRVAHEGIVFSHAYTTSPCVISAFGSIWTGLFPVSHGATSEWPYLSPEMPSLASTLRAHAYRTAAFCPDPALAPERGFGNGCETFVTLRWRHSMLQRARTLGQRAADRWLGREDGLARRTNLAFFRWLDRLGPEERFFAYVHYPDGDTRKECASFDLTTQWSHVAALASRRLAAIVDGLEQRKQWEHTMLVVTATRGCWSTSGNNILERDSLCEAAVRVPLLLRLPQPGPRGFVVDEFTQLPDLFSTILYWAGVLGWEEKAGHGRVLLHDAAVTEGPESVVVEEYRSPDKQMLWRRRLWRTRQYRLLWRSDETLQLFDLTCDPEEQNNLAYRRPELAMGMRKQLFDWLAAQDIFVPPTTETVDERQRQLQTHIAT